MTWIGAIVRFIVAALTLMFVGWLVPGFEMLNFTTALLAALVIAALGWVIERIFGDRVSPYARGLVGFFTSVAVIYLTQFVIEGMSVTLLGAILAALVIGLIDLFIPGDLKGTVMGGRRDEK